MDVKKPLLATLIAMQVMLMACSKDKTEENVFPLSESCKPSAVQTRYLVQWETGEITIEKGESREQFIEDFVKPNLDLIKHVEFEHLVKIEPMDVALKEVGNKALSFWGPQRVNAAEAWASNEYGSGVIVAVIDDGVDLNHPQLAGRIQTNAGESGIDSGGQDKRFNGIDDDNNGYVDDYAGYNFGNGSADNTPDTGHGTHISGVIAAEHNDTTYNNSYTQGLAPQAKILPLDFINAFSGGYISQAIEAIDYAVAAGAQVINASWGGTECSQLLKEKIDSLYSKEIIFVAAAGNEGNNVDYAPEYPSAFISPAQITVGSVGRQDFMAAHSNFSSSRVDIFAPGVDILSTAFGGVAGMTGTSMATPFVTGTIALLLGKNPNASIEDITDALDTYSDKSANYINKFQGRLNAGQSVTNLPK